MLSLFQIVFPRQEILSLLKIYLIRMVDYLVEMLLPQAMCYISIIVYVYNSDAPLTPTDTILLISYFNTMCQTFSFDFMKAVTNTINAIVSLNRIKVTG